MNLSTLNWLISNTPVAYPFPIKTLIARSKKKLKNIQWRHPKLQFFKASSISVTDDNVVYLKFNRSTVLAQKGELIVVPNDDYMPRRISFFGYWSEDLSKFLASGINKNTMLLDLGAHCGLVSLQTFNLSFVPKLYAVEPKKDNLKALRTNLKKIEQLCNIEIVDAAVTNIKGKTGNLYRQAGATMNSSVNSCLPGLCDTTESEITIETVKTIQSMELCKNILSFAGTSEIALKSDLQGMDVKILSEFSDIFWSKVRIGSIEICSLQYGAESEINLLIRRLKNFKQIFIDDQLTREISFEHLSKFYTSNSNKTLNLYFKRDL